MARIHPLVVAVVGLSLLGGGWMVFDGTRALLWGDYVTPSEGAHAGELGPWADLVAWLGIAPRSLGMKVFFVLYGATWIGTVVYWAWRGRGRWVSCAVAAGAAWYLIIGTLIALVVAGLLALPTAGAWRGMRRAAVTR